MKEYRYSAIDTAYSCLQKYKYIYVDGIKSPTTLDMAFGTGMHLVPQCYFEGEDPVATFNMYWDSVKGLYEANRFTWDQYKAMGEIFTSRWIRLHAKNYKAIDSEKSLSVDFEGGRLSGTPDLIGYYKDKLSVVDFKTSSYEYPRAKLEINEQMYIYAYMANITYGLNITHLVYNVFVKNPEPRIQTIEIELTQPKLKSMISNVALMVKDLGTRDNFPRNRNNCIMGKDYKCSFFERCYSE